MKDEDDDEDEDKDKDKDEDKDKDKKMTRVHIQRIYFGLDFDRNTFEKILQGKTTLGVERPF